MYNYYVGADRAVLTEAASDLLQAVALEAAGSRFKPWVVNAVRAGDLNRAALTYIGQDRILNSHAHSVKVSMQACARIADTGTGMDNEWAVQGRGFAAQRAMPISADLGNSLIEAALHEYDTKVSPPFYDTWVQPPGYATMGIPRSKEEFALASHWGMLPGGKYEVTVEGTTYFVNISQNVTERTQVAISIGADVSSNADIICIKPWGSGPTIERQPSNLGTKPMRDVLHVMYKLLVASAEAAARYEDTTRRCFRCGVSITPRLYSCMKTCLVMERELRGHSFLNLEPIYERMLVTIRPEEGSAEVFGDESSSGPKPLIRLNQLTIAGTNYHLTMLNGMVMPVWYYGPERPNVAKPLKKQVERPRDRHGRLLPQPQERVPGRRSVVRNSALAKKFASEG